MNQLLDRGVAVDMRGFDGRTPLSHAKRPSCSGLLEGRVKVDLVNEHGQTPLGCRGREAVLPQLLDRGIQ